MGERKWITITVPVEMLDASSPGGDASGTFETFEEDVERDARRGLWVRHDRREMRAKNFDIVAGMARAWPSEPTTDYAKRLAEIEAKHAAAAGADLVGGRAVHADRGWLLAQHRAASSALTVFGVPEDGRSLSERIEDIRSQATLEGEVARLTKRLEALGDNPDNGRQIVCGKCKDVAWNVCTHMANNVGDYQDTRRALTAAGIPDDGRPLAERAKVLASGYRYAESYRTGWEQQRVLRDAETIARATAQDGLDTLKRAVVAAIVTLGGQLVGDEGPKALAGVLRLLVDEGEEAGRDFADTQRMMQAEIERLTSENDAAQAALRAAKVLGEDGALGPAADAILRAAAMLKRIALGSTVEHACADPATCRLCNVPTSEESAAIVERLCEASEAMSDATLEAIRKRHEYIDDGSLAHLDRGDLLREVDRLRAVLPGVPAEPLVRCNCDSIGDNPCPVHVSPDEAEQLEAERVALMEKDAAGWRAASAAVDAAALANMFPDDEKGPTS